MRQFFQHFLLGAPEDERLRQVLQFLQLLVGFLRVSVEIARLELFVFAQHARIDELEQVPEVRKAVLHRRSRQDDACLAPQLHGCVRHFGPTVLDLVRFVQADDVPFPPLDILGAVHQHAVRTKYDVRRADILNQRCPVLDIVDQQRAQ